MALFYETGNPRPKREALPEHMRLYIEKLERELRSLRFHNEESQTAFGGKLGTLAWLESLHLWSRNLIC
jgi:hypothetical protein